MLDSKLNLNCNLTLNSLNASERCGMNHYNNLYVVTGLYSGLVITYVIADSLIGAKAYIRGSKAYSWMGEAYISKCEAIAQ